MLKFKEYLAEAKKKRSFRIFEDGEMSFGEIRDAVSDLFKTNPISVHQQKPSCQIGVTCNEKGQVCAIRDSVNANDPTPISKFASSYEGKGAFKDAFKNTVDGIGARIDALDDETKKTIFDNGHVFMKFDIISPASEKAFDKANNRMLAVNSGISRFNDSFEESPLGEGEEELAQKALSIFSLVNDEKMKKPKTPNNGDPLARDVYKLSEEAVNALAQTPDKSEIVNEVMKILDGLVDGLGYRGTLNDYIRDRYERKIVNCATKAGIEMRRSSDFVSELSDRLSKMSARRPTMGDLATYAKKEGIDIKSEQYKNFVKGLDDTLDTDNAEMVKPISNLLNKISSMFLHSIAGYVSLEDPKLMELVNSTLAQLDSESELTDQNLQILKNLFVKLRSFANAHKDGDSYLFMKNDRPYCLKCQMPNIETFGNKILKV